MTWRIPHDCNFDECLRPKLDRPKLRRCPTAAHAGCARCTRYHIHFRMRSLSLRAQRAPQWDSALSVVLVDRNHAYRHDRTRCTLAVCTTGTAPGLARRRWLPCLPPRPQPPYRPTPCIQTSSLKSKALP